MQIYYDKDCDLSIIQSQKVSVIGYGSRPRAGVQPKGFGVDVTVGLRAGSSSVAKAEAHGLKVLRYRSCSSSRPGHDSDT